MPDEHGGHGVHGARDEVDGILAGWAQARPDLDASPLAVFSRVTRIARMLDFARGRAFSAHGIEVWEFDVLSVLRREDEGEGLTPGALMAENLVSSGTMTNRLQRLEAHGFVSRVQDEKDRRVVRVRLTDAGRATVDASLGSLLAEERRLLQALPPAERATLADLLRSILAPMEREVAPGR